MQDVVDGKINTALQSSLYLALELSTKTWVMAIKSAVSDKISQYRVEGGDTTSLVSLIRRLQAKVADAPGEAVAAVSCYEAGRDGFGLHRLLSKHCNHVIDPASIRVSRRARRAKTDWPDADTLVRVLMAYCRASGRRAAWCAFLRSRKRTLNGRAMSASAWLGPEPVTRSGSKAC